MKNIQINNQVLVSVHHWSELLIGTTPINVYTTQLVVAEGDGIHDVICECD